MTLRSLCSSGDEDGGPGFVGIVLSFDTKRLTAQARSCQSIASGVVHPGTGALGADVPRALALPLRHTCLIPEFNVRAAFYMRDHAGMCYFVLPLSKQFRLKCPEAMARLGGVRCCIVYSFCRTDETT